MPRARSPNPKTDVEEGNRRRRALRAFMASRDLNAADWARRARLPNANAIYNFLNGRSQSLSMATYEHLARAADVPVAELLGSSQSETLNFVAVVVAGAACKDRWARTSHGSSDILGLDALPVPHGVEAHFALRVTDDHAAAFKVPRGALLLVADLSMTQSALAYGDLVVVKRVKNERVETTIRQVVKQHLTNEGRATDAALVFGTEASPGGGLPLQTWPHRSDTGPFRIGSDRYEIIGRVTWACYSPIA